MNGCAPGLALIDRLKATRKWAIAVIVATDKVKSTLAKCGMRMMDTIFTKENRNWRAPGLDNDTVHSGIFTITTSVLNNGVWVQLLATSHHAQLKEVLFLVYVCFFALF